MIFTKATLTITETIYKRCVHTTRHLSKVQPNNLKGRSSSSQKWLTRQLADPFVEKAKMENYRYEYAVYYHSIKTITMFNKKVSKCF